MQSGRILKRSMASSSKDYNKGVVTRNVIHAVVDAAHRAGIPVTVDPKFNNFFEYRGGTVFKPKQALKWKMQWGSVSRPRRMSRESDGSSCKHWEPRMFS